MVVSDQKILQKKQKGALIQGGALSAKPGSPSSKETGYQELQVVNKASLTRLRIEDLPREIPDFKTPGTTKDALVTEYLTQYITTALEEGTITESHLLPRKEEIAKFLGVSVGTVQNAIRIVEDMGHVESKQRIGTMIRDSASHGHRLRKQTSKRDQAVIAVKKFIVDRGIEVGEPLPSAREISAQIGSAPNTTRLALEFLTNQGVLHSRGTRGNKANWELKEVPDLSDDPSIAAIESETLIDQLERDLKELIAQEYQINEKLPSHLELAEQFKVSIKTVHDAMKRLSDQGVIRSKRGRYGTFVCRKPDTQFFTPAENIFVSVDDTTFYNYEKVERHLKQLIKAKYKVGDKLPAMGQLSKELDVSSNTIRKALQNLAKEEVVTFTRGRYGGTFVTRVPEVETDKAFTWVSINPETIKSYRQDKVIH